jgi:trehalose utilization protein
MPVPPEFVAVPSWQFDLPGGGQLEVLPGVDDDPATVDNVDGFITAPDGSVYGATFLTTAAIDTILMNWSVSGEVGHGAYFWCVGQVIIPRPGTDAMVAAAAELLRTGDVATVCVPAAEAL